MSAWTERLQPSLDTAQQELERRAAALVEIQSQELARRGELAMATWTERLQPSLESAAQETVARLGAQFEQHLGSHIDRANQVLGRLESESHCGRGSAAQTGRSPGGGLEPHCRSRDRAIAEADRNSATRFSRSWPPRRRAVACRD